jgi:aminoglycoside phosphotransferase (APT) family kinase protein
VVEERSQSEVADRLLPYLRAELGRSDLSFAEAPARITGGNETYIYGFRLRGAPEHMSGPLILRVYRAGYARPDQARFESAVQNAIASLGYPAARVPLACHGNDVLGTPFIIMERLPGSTLLEGVGGPDASGTMRFSGAGRLLRSFRLLWEIPRQIAAAQVRLHAFDPQPLLDAIQREELSREALTVEGRLNALDAYIDANRLDGLRDAFEWLRKNVPAPARLAICHCDMQPINILVADGAITGVVDWSQVIVADPAIDVGYTKVAMDTVPLVMPPGLSWLGRPIARIVSRGYVSQYTKQRPVQRSSLEYYGVLRALFALAGLAARRAGGTTEPDVWDNPAGVGNLIGWIRSVTGITPVIRDDARAGDPQSA